jgi:hypothetical protein
MPASLFNEALAAAAAGDYDTTNRKAVAAYKKAGFGDLLDPNRVREICQDAVDQLDDAALVELLSR